MIIIRHESVVMKVQHHIVLAVLIAAFSSVKSSAQQKPEQGQTLAFELLPYIGDERLQRELLLTPEQVKALLARRQKIWDEEWGASRTAFSQRWLERNLETEGVFEKTLSSEQLRRAKQLVLQKMLDRRSNPADRSRISSRVLQQSPEFASPLGLDLMQMELVEIGSLRTAVFLTSEQTVRARKMLGKLASTSAWDMDFDPRFAAQFKIRTQNLQSLTRVDAIELREELKLTAEQLQTLTRLHKQFQVTFEMSLQERAGKIAALKPRR